MPDFHETALALIERSERYAAPSANISGQLSPTKGAMWQEDMREQRGYYLTRRFGVGLESTVIDAEVRIPLFFEQDV